MRRSFVATSVLAVAGVCVLLVASACDGDDEPVTSTEFRTASAGATQAAVDGVELFGQTVLRDGTPVAVRRLPDGTLVAERTPLSAEEATAVAASFSPTPVASAAASPTPDDGTPVPVPTAAGSGRVQFASLAPITAAVGAEFSMTIIADAPDRAFQGYQWNIYSGATIEVLREEPNEDSSYETCVGLNNVAVNQNYGGCIDLGPERTDTYAGPLTVVYFRCASAGTTEIRLLNALEGTPFGTVLLNVEGAEFGGTNPTPVAVTCT